ncbi:helix-turn-helix domain-containing protein [Streptomyces thermodiastaticus]|uniref:helix-turn-helix domain-containing protein n=1 Tax=Streptomyces thermodiastaticus TaxID=44061 RepID=UPI0016757D15|nr:helix-turn-helix transcriptional regulator [Streptomyces thermodiastaticus]MCE7550870.1 helix-turn-helix transcriptional regulator [Streptomyces thermodiastaticus]
MQPNGQAIRRQREERGYGLRRFAEAAGISHSHLSRIERGQRGAQPEVMARIAELIGCRITDIQRNPTRSNDERDEHRIALHDDEGTRGHPADHT